MTRGRSLYLQLHHRPAATGEQGPARCPHSGEAVAGRATAAGREGPEGSKRCGWEQRPRGIGQRVPGTVTGEQEQNATNCSVPIKAHAWDRPAGRQRGRGTASPPSRSEDVTAAQWAPRGRAQRAGPRGQSGESGAAMLGILASPRVQGG